MTTKKKITHKHLQEDSRERLIEMIVDRITNYHSAIGLQFWRDVRLYSLDEAICYLKNYLPDADYSKLDRVVEEIREQI